MNASVDKTSTPRVPAWLRRLNLKRFSPFIGIALFAAALFVLHRSAREFRVHDVLGFIEALPTGRVIGAVGLVLLNFLLFTVYDGLALRYIGCRMPLGKVAGTAMLGFAFSNVVGGMVLAGGGIRYRSYSGAGLSAPDILRMTLFIWMTWLVGLAACVGVSACFYPHGLDPALPVQVDLRWIGVPVCLGVAVYLTMTARGGREWVLRGIKWPLPGLNLALGQVAVTALDLLLSAAILYLLLPSVPGLTYSFFTALFVLALTLALFSGIPGGLGVFEVLILHLLNGIMDYLFTSLLLWGRKQGYAVFNMGMAPLAGLNHHPLSPIFTRMGVWIYRHGEHFYNFQGLRHYKDKFSPQWRPSYLASLGSTQLASEIWSINALVSGGLLRMIPRPGRRSFMHPAT